MKRFAGMVIGAGIAAALVVSQVAGTSSQVQVPGIDKPVVVQEGRITSDATWSNDFYHVLRGAVFVEAGATLTVEPGTTIVGETATAGTLIVARGGRIVADGRQNAPIVMTSDQPVGQRGVADWGGLIINGRAPLNVPGGEAEGEGDTGVYGGDDPNDDSGILRYVRVEYAGIEFSPDNELNGIAFQGVGRRTVIEHIQVHMNQDDGVEFFGGTADAKYVLLTNIRDDSLDWTDGWTGRIQYLIARQWGTSADNAIEADNNADNNNFTPRSNPTIYNITLIGDPIRGIESDDGMLLREGTAGTIRNFIVMGFKEWGININHAATIQQAERGNLRLSHGILFNNGVLPGFGHLNPAAAQFFGNEPTIVTGNPGLIDPFNLERPNFRPRSAATLAGGQLAPATPPNDGFFEVTSFVGALGPDEDEDWTLGWTNYAVR